MSFESIIGHQLPIRLLRNGLSTGYLSHSYLFCGIEGIGKMKTAVSFAKALNCKERQDDFCDKCICCRKIERKIHPDIFYIEPEIEKKVIQIDTIREQLKKIIFKPLEGQKQVVIIDQAEKLNSQAANCLLKTLEEPPEDTIIILVASTSLNQFPTIVSRCQVIRFSPLKENEIFIFMKNRQIHEAQANLVSSLAQGSIKRALFLIENDFLEKRKSIVRHLLHALSNSFEAILLLSKMMSASPQEALQILEFLQLWYRDIFLIKKGVADTMLYNRDIKKEMFEAAKRETVPGILKKIKIFQRMQKSIGLNFKLDLAMESALMDSMQFGC